MIEFRTPEERAAMRHQRKLRRAMSKGVDNSRIQNVGGEYGGSLTAEEQRDVMSGKEKIANNMQEIAKQAAIQLATSGIGNIVSKGLTTGIAAAEKSRDVALAGKSAAEGLMTSAEAAMNVDDFLKASSQFDQFSAQALKSGNKANFLNKAKDPILNTINKAPEIISFIRGKENLYGVNPEDEKITMPSGPEYSLFNPNGLD